MKPQLHIPIDFEQRDDVRTLGRIMRQRQVFRDGPGEMGLAVLYCLRLWLDWGRAGVEWRPLQQARREPRDWSEENLAHLLVDACGFPSDPGDLMELLLESGVLSVVPRGELDGLVLTDFATCNPHLLPGYESIHSKGGRIKAEKRAAEENEQLAVQQVRVLKQAGLALFVPGDNVSEEEQQKCIALIMGFDGACGRAMRSSTEYVADEALMRDALHVLRGHAWEDIVLVQRYVRARRADPQVVKETAAILRAFDAHLGKAKQ